MSKITRQKYLKCAERQKDIHPQGGLSGQGVGREVSKTKIINKSTIFIAVVGFLSTY